jgi:hypothetical protein
MLYKCGLQVRLGEWRFGTREHMLPVFKLRFKCSFKMLKILNTKFSGYILKFYTFKKWFHRKPTF